MHTPTSLPGLTYMSNMSHSQAEETPSSALRRQMLQTAVPTSASTSNTARKTKVAHHPKSDAEGKILIFRPWRRLKDGTIIYAKSYGKTVFPMWVTPAEAAAMGVKIA